MENRKYRHELKFLCDEAQLLLLEKRIQHICKSDKHACESGTYMIRSLYFDTMDNACYLENEMGTDRRKKYRIRIYNGKTDYIKLECKYSIYNMKAKESCRITKEQCQQLMKGKPVSGLQEEQELLRRFLVERRLQLLEPKVIVEYVRTPYIYEAGNVRVTFDRNISSAGTSGFLSGCGTRRSILPSNVHVLEVKYDEVFPSAILDMVAGGQQLSKTSFSKYALCREYSTR